MMGFEWPWIFILVPLPLLILRAGTEVLLAIRVPDRVAKQLEESRQKTSAQRSYSLCVLWVAWLCLLISIAQPYVRGESEIQPANGRTLVMVVDLSASMERKDFLMAGEQVDRLTVVKEVAGQFIENRKGDRLGLVLFGSEAFVASPPSFDLAAVKSMLMSSGTGMAGRTTAIGDALGLAIQSLRTDPASQKAIILLSDGTNNSGTAEPEGAAKLAFQLGITVHTIGLGSREGPSTSNTLYTTAAADLDEAALHSIANAASGEFFRAHTTTELEVIYEKINALESADSAAPSVVIKRDIRNYFVLLVLLCGLLNIVAKVKSAVFVGRNHL